MTQLHGRAVAVSNKNSFNYNKWLEDTREGSTRLAEKMNDTAGIGSVANIGNVGNKSGGTTGKLSNKDRIALERTAASIFNGIGAGMHGIGSAVENFTDGVATVGSKVVSLFTLFYDDVTGGDVTGNMHKAVMGHVEKNYVDKTFEKDYKENELAKWADEEAYEPFKRTGAGYQLASGGGYILGQIGLAALGGGSNIAAATVGGLSGAGRAASEYWTEAKEAANGVEWRTEENYAKGVTYANAIGLWEGLQWGIGSKIQSVHLSGASAIQESAARVAFDTVFNAADTPYRTTAKLASIGEKITDKTWKEEFEKQGGWTQVGMDVILGAAFSAFGETLDYKNNKAMKQLNKKTVNSRNLANEYPGAELFDMLARGNQRYGVDQGVLSKIRIVDRQYYTNIRNKFARQHNMPTREVERLMQFVDSKGACSYACAANDIVSHFERLPDVFEREFGFPLYRRMRNGNNAINDAELLLDMFYWVNHYDNGGSLIYTGADGTNRIISFDPITGRRVVDASKQRYMMTTGIGRGESIELLNDYLESKSGGRLHAETLYINGDPQGRLSRTEMSQIKGNAVRKMNDGYEVSLYIRHDANNPIRFLNPDTSNIYTTTATWHEGGAHAVKVTDATIDGFVVSSWGKKLLIPYTDLMNNGQFATYYTEIYFRL